MAGSSQENLMGIIVQPTTTQGGQKRRVLGSLDQNIISDPYANGLPGKRANPCKKPLVPVRGPITRGVSAQVTTKPSPALPEGKKPKNQTIHVALDAEGCSIITVENDFSEKKEAMLEDIDTMDVDVYEELIINIDDENEGDPLAVVEYIDEIYKHYKEQEITSCVSHTYMSQQHDITGRMRAILVDWLIEVHYKFELMEETLYLTVNLIDRFLESQTVSRKQLQLVGITAMLLACKYEEVSVPLVNDFVVISDKAYTRIEVLEMEKQMVNTLKFNLSVPTQYVFIKRFLKTAKSSEQLALLAFYMIDMCLVEYESLKFSPSLLAAAAVFTAECTLNRSKKWTKTCQVYSNYSEIHLMECSQMMVTLHQKSGTGKLVAVFNKYAASKYGWVARIEPADFVLYPTFWR
ncbi:G2/mitotic-specific cyclin-2-like [Bidens hawaiensis]|uniref:G2/mitotic-specific cyclin-2-like n=1 Tax=Bidens hawaiensis TaxID=980011 RepID=UPI00404B9988